MFFADIISGGSEFEGFNGLSLALLTVAVLSLGGWMGLAVVRWFATRPRLPQAAAPTNVLRGEPPAIVNFLVNRCHVTRLAVAATFLDLAARRYYSVDMLDLEHGVVRLRRDADPGKLNDYERQVYEAVSRRATGGSAPLEVIEVGNDSWFGNFQKKVRSDARSRHLAGSRWTPLDHTIVGVGLAIILGLFALSFASAGLFVSDTGSDDDFSRIDWLWVAGVAWLVLLIGFNAMRSMRETARGREAAAHWLGYQDYCRQTAAFENQPPAAVTIWERYLGHAVAVGSAHDTAEALPFATEDPETAWTRSTGIWRQIRIEYPTRFGFGQVPWKAALEGFVKMAFWGALAFVALPILLPVVLDQRDNFRDSFPDENQANLRWVILGVIAFQTVLGGWWALQAIAGGIRFIRGVADLGRTVVVEGEVVKIHQNRVAVDNGRDDEVDAWYRPAICPSLGRGTKVRVTRTPNLHYVTKVEVLGE